MEWPVLIAPWLFRFFSVIEAVFGDMHIDSERGEEKKVDVSIEWADAREDA